MSGGGGKDQAFDHEFDGIREYDNRLPNWWLYILYGSIVFALGYWLYYHTYHVGKLPNRRYELEVIAATEAQLKRMEGQETTNESLVLLSSLPDRRQEGRAIFVQFCVVCHADQGQGNVGPNLTDGMWIHGGSPLEILHTVTNGVPEKGMAAWGNQLGPTRVQNAVSYVLSIKNTNVAGKAPEGVPEAAQATPGEAAAPPPAGNGP
jgi:cytochrome c oxidase cbb3-type subunit 3